MIRIKVYNQMGEAVGEEELTSEIFEVAPNEGLVHQVVVAQLARVRQIIAHTKDRGDVRGGGIKPWRQKGTGRARHGSIRSPLWKGGGVTFGPRKNRVFSQKINKKMRQKALRICLTDKVKSQRLILLDKLEIPEAKTKSLVEIIKNLQTKLKMNLDKGTLLALGRRDEKIQRAGHNIPYLVTAPADSLNVVALLKSPYLMITREGLQKIKETYKL